MGRVAERTGWDAHWSSLESRLPKAVERVIDPARAEAERQEQEYLAAVPYEVPPCSSFPEPQRACVSVCRATLLLSLRCLLHVFISLAVRVL